MWYLGNRALSGTQTTVCSCGIQATVYSYGIQATACLQASYVKVLWHPENYPHQPFLINNYCIPAFRVVHSHQFFTALSFKSFAALGGGGGGLDCTVDLL